jgi:hypothetical protein
MVREAAIDLAIERHHFAADAFQHLRPERAGHAVAGVDDDLQRRIDLDVAGDAVDVVVLHV